MSDHEPDDLLWSLPPSAEEAGDLPSGEHLAAYREGRLDAAEAAELEDLLARSAAARRGLVASAGVTLPAPSAALRSRVLDRLAPRRRRPTAAWLTAAALVVALAGAWWWRALPGAGLPAMTVEVSGLLADRGTASAATPARAYPKTPVRFSAEPVGAAGAGLALAVYRPVAGELVRVGPVGEAWHGRFELTAEATVWVGAERGPVLLLVALARTGELPERLAVPLGASPAAVLAAGGKRRVVERILQVDEP